MSPLRVGIIGGGIVGLATAVGVTHRFPQAVVSVIEKERGLGLHQTGHNSGVIHSGIYYRPGSLKARLCVEGSKRLKVFCREHAISVQVTGKVIVATSPEESAQLEELKRRAVQNSIVGVEKIGRKRLREIEPYAEGNEALVVPETAIVDYTQVANAYAKVVTARGGTIHTDTQVIKAAFSHGTWKVYTEREDFTYDILINCGGLFSDRIAELCGAKPDVRIIPFRGEYFKLKSEYEYLVKGLIYPTPNPALPFLGVHFSRHINGSVGVGPNAVLAFAREGYKKTDVRLSDMVLNMTFVGFWKLLGRYGKIGAFELYRSLSKRAFVHSLQQLVPDITADMLEPAESGVRAQAVDRSGRLVDDFLFMEQRQALHVLNAPSPAATSSIVIGEIIAEKLSPYVNYLK